MQTLEFCTLELHLESVELVAKYRQPFDALAVAVASEQERMGEGSPKNGQFENWLPHRGRVSNFGNLSADGDQSGFLADSIT